MIAVAAAAAAAAAAAHETMNECAGPNKFSVTPLKLFALNRGKDRVWHV